MQQIEVKLVVIIFHFSETLHLKNLKQYENFSEIKLILSFLFVGNKNLVKAYINCYLMDACIHKKKYQARYCDLQEL